MGLLSGFYVAFLSILSSGGGEKGGIVASIFFFAAGIISAIICSVSSTPKESWGKGFLLLSIESFALPIAALIFDSSDTNLTVLLSVAGLVLGIAFGVLSYFMLWRRVDKAAS
jgi:hypothetical protein